VNHLSESCPKVRKSSSIPAGSGENEQKSHLLSAEHVVFSGILHSGNRSVSLFSKEIISPDKKNLSRSSHSFRIL
jgi:hypothetical protein